MMVIWLVVWNMTGLWLSIQLGMASSQLTNEYIFQRDCFTTNQGIFNLTLKFRFHQCWKSCVFFLWLKTHVELVMFVDEILSRTSFVGWKYAWITWIHIWLVVSIIFYVPFHILGMSSSQLTLHNFSEGLFYQKPAMFVEKSAVQAVEDHPKKSWGSIGCSIYWSILIQISIYLYWSIY